MKIGGGIKLFSQDKPITYKLYATVGNGIYRHDGSSWSLFYTAPNPTAAEWSNSYAFGENDLWFSFAKDGFGAPPPPYPDANSSYSYVYHYNGGTWTSYFLVDIRIRSFWGVSSSDLWALGQTGNKNVEYWHFNGASWTKVYTAPTYARNLFSLCGSATNKVWGGRCWGYDNGWHKFEYGYNGSSWSEYRDTPGGSMNGSPSLRYNSYDSKFYFWATDNDDGAKQKIYTHTNAIDSSGWTIVHNNNISMGNLYNNVLWVYQNKIWAATGQGNPVGIQHYNGSSWSNVSMAGQEAILCLEGYNDIIWVAGRGPGAYAHVWKRASDGTWTTYNLGLYNQFVQSIAVVPT